MDSARFGIEIEVIVEPHTLRTPLNALAYYERLASSLRKRGQGAKVDGSRSYKNRYESFDKWLITKDGSLDGHGDNQVALEAVSPIFNTAERWIDSIDAFWNALSAVFHQPIQSPKCGCHVHVSPGPRNRFSFGQFKTIAFGVIIYEPLVLQVLPPWRRNHDYCRPNTASSSCFGVNRGLNRQVIASARSLDQLIGLMQTDRKVLWNFGNILPSKSGTVEFRGGRGLRGRNRTGWWIAFAISFIHFVLKEDAFGMQSIYSEGNLPSIERFYASLRLAAREIGMGSHLPSDHYTLSETRR
ncbi:putative amidoligase enzyme-domain-containing protein [Rostrohypoxylon terebratum]|nr:putative amidoligase enzyme-domain-containing protein [Rostrohypoxylon terebratum]